MFNKESKQRTKDKERSVQKYNRELLRITILRDQFVIKRKVIKKKVIGKEKGCQIEVGYVSSISVSGSGMMRMISAI